MDDVTLMVRICKWIIMRIKWINGKVSWSQKDTVWWYRTHRGKFIYFHPEEDLVLALTPSGSYFLYHAEWTIINFSITTVWQRTSKAPMGLAHQKPEKNTIPWYLSLGTGIFHNTLRGIVPLAMQLVLFYSKSDTRSTAVALTQGITVLIWESDTQGRPNRKGSMMCHQKRNSRTCTKREEEESGLKETYVMSASDEALYWILGKEKNNYYENAVYNLHIFS